MEMHVAIYVYSVETLVKTQLMQELSFKLKPKRLPWLRLPFRLNLFQ